MHRTAQKNNRTGKILAWSGGSLVALLAIGYFGGQAWLSGYLRSDAFRKKIEERSGITLRSEVMISPPRLENSQFFTDGFEARGTKEAGFAKLKVENIRGDYKMPSFLKLLLGDRQVSAENIVVERVTADFNRQDRLELTLPPREPGPHNVEVKNATVRQVNLTWPGGSFTRGVARIKAVEGGWQINGEGGRLATVPELPIFDVTSARLVYKELERSIIVQEARAQAAGGEVTATGEMDPSTHADLRLDLQGVNVTPLLPTDWRARLHGKVNGEGMLRMSFNDGHIIDWRLNGKVSLKQGRIEALPVLHKIAEFTNTDQFRQFQLDQLSGDFSYDHRTKTLRVTNFVLESRQLLRVTGSFTVVDKQLDGSFDVGITPNPLQWLASVQNKVFNTQHSGYAWAKMRLTGTTDSPKEDLSDQLADAVTVKAAETFTGAAGTTIEVGKKAATGVLDMFFGSGNTPTPIPIPSPLPKP